MTAIRQIRGGFGDSAFADTPFASRTINFEIITIATLSNTLSNLTPLIVAQSTTGLGGFYEPAFLPHNDNTKGSGFWNTSTKTGTGSLYGNITKTPGSGGGFWNNGE
jgi:hypothetical protein